MNANAQGGGTMRRRNEPVTLATTATDYALVVRLGGEVDLLTAGPMEVALRDATAELPPPDLVVLDLTAITFFSVAGAHTVDSFAATCAERGVRTHLIVDSSSTVYRLIQMTELCRRTPMFTTLEQALPAPA